MPGYLSVAGVEQALQNLVATYPAFVTLINLPNTSVEGRASHAVKIGSGTGTKRGLLLIAGLHARELVNPDLVLTLAYNLCKAYSTHTGLTFGGKSYDATAVRLIVEGLDVFVFPLVNPDGRAFVQAPGGDRWWRKNRNPNPGQACKGVDLNRNFDFLWPSGIGTSANPCSEVYKGAGGFSEPEIRNVQWLPDNYPQIGFIADVHSYSELILYPWGDDENQTTNAGMNFMNPAYNAVRGVVGDTSYKEYIPAAELNWYATTAGKVRDAIAAVRGRVYTAQQEIQLYPTTGTSVDYTYARHFVDPAKHRVYAITLETGREFQPADAEALQIISEVSAGLIEFCLASLCAVEETMDGTALEKEADRLRLFRDREMLKTKAGRRYVQLLATHSVELLRLSKSEKALHEEALAVLQRVAPVIPEPRQRQAKVIDRELLKSVASLLKKTKDKSSPALGLALDALAKDLRFFKNRTVVEGLKAASQ